VDRALEASHNRIIIAIVEGELTVKRLIISNGIYYLCPENPDYSTIEITEHSDFSVWGVVTYVIHKT
jgi:DNA polymerase V